MNNERARRALEIFESLLDVDPADLEAEIDQRCGEDADLRAEVVRLLAASDLPTDVLQTLSIHRDVKEAGGIVAAAAAVQPGAGDIGRTIGQYTIVGVLGQGGMGTVYRATQMRPQREVALKLVRSEFASPQLVRRFEFEAELLGRLTHPGVAQIYEAGIDPATGSPYFAMELVQGVSLTAYAERHELGVRDRLRLFADICRAVQYAHSRGVIHRDLKPGNILVTEVGDPPHAQPKILDFGVARLTDADVQTATLRTDIGQLIGTVPYMSPEQVEGDPAALDTRSDVYALGVVLYELLVGRLPYNMRDRLIHEAVRVIREEEPTRLSSINRTLRGDVETIVGKALEKERERRYQTAADFASDIDRYLSNEPIQARPASAAYQLRKFASRHRALVGGVIATFVVLIVGIISTAVFAVRAEDRRVDAVNAQLAETEAKREAQENAAAAKLAEQAERERAEELEKVATFQQAQLSEINVSRMGSGMRDTLMEEIRAELERTETDPGQIDKRLAAVEPLIQAADFTGMALEALNANFFQRTQAAIDDQFADQPLLRARLLQTLADTMKALGLMHQSQAAQEEALALRRAELGDEHEDTIYSFGRMAIQHYFQGRILEAMALLEETLALSRRALGNDHEYTLIYMNNLAWLLQNADRQDEAEGLMREALAGYKRAFGDDHPDIVKSLVNLGFLMANQGRFDEAESYLRERLAHSQRTEGADHPLTYDAHYDLGSMLLRMGSYERAEPEMRIALEGHRRLFGEDHHDYLRDLTGLSVLYRARGDYAEAEKYCREAVERARRVLGEQHPQTLNDISNLGEVLRLQGRFEEAEPLLKSSLAGRRRALGDDHLQTFESLTRLGKLLLQTDRAEEAEVLLRELNDRCTRIFGADHWRTRAASIHVCEAQVRLGRYAEAERSLLGVLEGLEDVNAATEQELLAVSSLIALYEAWHDADPDQGYDGRAAEWRARMAGVEAVDEPEGDEGEERPN